jgi:hypothetical protein
VSSTTRFDGSTTWTRTSDTYSPLLEANTIWKLKSRSMERSRSMASELMPPDTNVTPEGRGYDFLASCAG